jgi:hypothetical protein
MRVFLSWSGGRSRAIAEAFGNWLGLAIQAVDPWMSPDIRKGVRWIEDLEKALDESKVGIFFVTKGSLASPWLHYEAGALSRSKGTLICSLLIDVSTEAVHFLPLEQFQQTTLSEDDVRKLLAAINDAVAAGNERNLSETRLNEAFDNSWSKLQERLEAIKKAIYEDEVSDPTDQSGDLMGQFVGTALAEASGGGLSVERLALSIAGAMQTDKSKDLDVKGIGLIASMMQNIYLPKLMRRGYVKKEGEQYALTEGGLSHYTEVVRSQVALEKRIEDMMRQGI